MLSKNGVSTAKLNLAKYYISFKSQDCSYAFLSLSLFRVLQSAVVNGCILRRISYVSLIQFYYRHYKPNRATALDLVATSRH